MGFQLRVMYLKEKKKQQQQRNGVNCMVLWLFRWETREGVTVGRTHLALVSFVSCTWKKNSIGFQRKILNFFMYSFRGIDCFFSFVITMTLRNIVSCKSNDKTILFSSIRIHICRVGTRSSSDSPALFLGSNTLTNILLTRAWERSYHAYNTPVPTIFMV